MKLAIEWSCSKLPGRALFLFILAGSATAAFGSPAPVAPSVPPLSSALSPWRVVKSPEPFFTIAHAGSQFAAVRLDGAVFTSPDAITWTMVAAPLKTGPATSSADETRFCARSRTARACTHCFRPAARNGILSACPTRTMITSDPSPMRTANTSASMSAARSSFPPTVSRGTIETRFTHDRPRAWPMAVAFCGYTSY